jgi:enamine deaminase RidA (YjgF/YER057c/UK114 family)
MTIQERLRELGIELPRASTPGANYVPFTRHENLIYLTGQLCQWNGERKFIGKLGREFGVEQGQIAARLCGLNLIAHLSAALEGDLDQAKQCLRLTGYVNATPDFEGHSQVLNGASDLFVQVFGDAGRHTRISVGVAGLPYGCAVEVEAIFSIHSRGWANAA